MLGGYGCDRCGHSCVPSQIPAPSPQHSSFRRDAIAIDARPRTGRRSAWQGKAGGEGANGGPGRAGELTNTPYFLSLTRQTAR